MLKHFGLLMITTLNSEGRRMWIFQRKDDTHPNPDYRGRLTLFGGAKVGKGPMESLQLRLSEQVDSSELVEILTQDIRTVRVVEVAEDEGMCDATIYMRQLTLDEFQRFRSPLLCLKEGGGVELSELEVQALTRRRSPSDSLAHTFLPGIAEQVRRSL